uniref:MerC domain-containing protein n=1 Tax=Roseihalotalea indica TaxID=2867963 RepID=A0AA49GJM7_9BACT|nr:MerC domain-containing protein [Tunicatimonas sp. TK19036]
MKSRQADILGMLSAILCIIHCLLVPVLLIAGLASGSFAGLWEYLDWVFIVLAWTAVYSATRHETNRRLAHFMWGTVCVFSITLLLHEYWILALYLSMASSAVLASLHFIHFQKKHLASEVTV